MLKPAGWGLRRIVLISYFPTPQPEIECKTGIKASLTGFA